MKTILQFVSENQPLIAIGLIVFIAMILAVRKAYTLGWEACCRSFASRAVTETRRHTSSRV